MKKPKKIWPFVLMLAIIIAVAAPLNAMEMLKPTTKTWRYKTTVTVETPEGIKTGVAVREVSNTFSKHKIIDLPNATSHTEVKGEAVVVDLGERGVLFALLSGYRAGPDHAYRVLFSAALDPGGSYLYAPLGARATLAMQDYPVLVTFKDPANPKSVTPVLELDVKASADAVTATVRADRFAELFGPGVKLKDITIEMTDEPVTWGVEKLLPWLTALQGKYLHGEFTSRGSPLGLSGIDFQKGRQP